MIKINDKQGKIFLMGKYMWWIIATWSLVTYWELLLEPHGIFGEGNDGSIACFSSIW